MGEYMRVLMTIDMTKSESRRLKFFDLSLGFALDLFPGKASPHGRERKLLEAGAKSRSRSAVGQRIEIWGNRVAIDQHDVTTRLQRRLCLCQRTRFGEGRRVGHHRRRSKHAGAIRFHDRAIHPGVEAKIVSIDDEPPHSVSLTKAFSPQRIQRLTEQS